MSESESGRFWSAKSSRKSRVRSTIFDISPAMANGSENIKRAADQFEGPPSLAQDGNVRNIRSLLAATGRNRR
jgi:hypothetical protein